MREDYSLFQSTFIVFSSWFVRCYMLQLAEVAMQSKETAQFKTVALLEWLILKFIFYTQIIQS